MNFFSSEPFLGTVADVLHPNKGGSIEPVRVGRETYRLLCLRDGQVVTHAPFLDFFEALPGSEPTRRSVAYLPRAARGVLTAAAWQASPHGPDAMPSPFIDWAGYATWDAFLADVHQRTPYPFKIHLRKQKKLEREVGPVRLEPTSDAAVVETALGWKSSQYQRTGHFDVFSVEKNRRLFFALAERGHLTMHALWAGDRLMAAHLGAVHDGRFYYWLPAHDPEAGAYSPGSLLLEALITESFRLRLSFDFLLGDEPYKWHFATHARLVEPVGQAPLWQRTLVGAKSLVAAQLRRHQPLYQFARRLYLKGRRLATS